MNSVANQGQISFRRESVFNEPPAANMVLRNIPFTKDALEADKKTEVSAEIRSDRMTQDLVKVGLDSTGSIDFELSDYPVWFDEFIRAAIGSDAVETAASGVLTFSGQPTNGNTVIINGVIYTFKTSLSTGPAVAFEVKIGADEATSIANLAAAINLTGVAATNYGTGTTINTDVTAVAAATTLTVTARVPGIEGNAIITTGNGTNTLWGGVVLTGGADPAIIANTALADDIAVTKISDRESLLTGTAATGLKKGRAVLFDSLFNAGVRTPGIVTEINDSTFIAKIRPNVGAVGTVTSSANFDRKEIKNGTTRRSFFIEKFYKDLGASIGFGGMTVDKMTLNFQSRKILTGTIAFIGGTPYTSPDITIASRNKVSGNVMSSTGAVGALKLFEHGARIKNATLNMTANIRGQDACGDESFIGVGDGRCDIDGTLEAYFDDVALFKAMLNNDAVSLLIGVTLGNYALAFYLPRIKLASAQPDISGVNTDVMIPLNFTALRDSTEDAEIIVSTAIAL